jgi:hypothetical protein
MEQTFNDLCREQRESNKGLFGLLLWVFFETSIEILRENLTFMTMNKNILRIALVTAFILLIPLVAMQFSNEVVWTLFDFIFAGTLLFGTGLAYELVAKKGGTTAYRAAVSMALTAGFFLIWINGAVGIIGNENNPANLLYFGVLAVGFLGAIIARLKPREMSYVLFATAAAQLLVPVIALLIWKPEFTPDVVKVFVLNAGFATLWAGSALLFRQAGEKKIEVKR